jgi:hypothetical protein
LTELKGEVTITTHDHAKAHKLVQALRILGGGVVTRALTKLGVPAGSHISGWKTEHEHQDFQVMGQEEPQQIPGCIHITVEWQKSLAAPENARVW